MLVSLADYSLGFIDNGMHNDRDEIRMSSQNAKVQVQMKNFEDFILLER